MAGRGRGRATSSFTQEQLQAMGCVGKDIPNVTATPSPLFPTLPSKPVGLEVNSDRSYKISWKEDFIRYLQESPYFTSPTSVKPTVQRNIAILGNLESNTKPTNKGEFPWHRMPVELRLNWKRVKKDTKAEDQVAAKKIKKPEDIEAKLNILEQKEKTGGYSDNKDSDSDETEEPDENEDEEMDDENDYGNNYFDNGESFNDEDDNLDDGPVY